MKIVKTTSLLSLILSCFGCTKDIVNQNPVNEPSTLLKKFVEIDTTKTAGSDTVVMFEFEYDGSKRVQLIRELYPPFSHKDYHSSVKFFYNENEMLPSLRLMATNPLLGSASQIDSSFLFYDSSWRILKDSTRLFFPFVNSGFLTTWSLFYSYEGDQVKIDENRSTLNTIKYTYDADSNLTKSLSTNTAGTNIEQSFTYDNHPNPFNSMTIGNYVVYNDDFGLPNFTSHGSRNNFLSIDFHYSDHSANWRYKNTFTYTYNAAGLPERVIFYVVDDTGATHYLKTGLYFY